MAREKRKIGTDTKLNMTPMIDVVFQLLIFFLVGTKFRIPEGELEAYLPNEGQPKTIVERLQDVDEIRVTLRVAQGGPTAHPSVLIDGTGSAAAAGAGSLKWLETELARLGTNKTIREEVPIIIEAEPHLAYKWVVQTLNIARRQKFVKVHFAASKRNAPLPGS